MCLSVAKAKPSLRSREHFGVPTKTIKLWKVVEIHPLDGLVVISSPYKRRFRWATGRNMPTKPLSGPAKKTIYGGVIHCCTTEAAAHKIAIRGLNQVVMPVFVNSNEIIAFGTNKDVACAAVFVRVSDFQEACGAGLQKMADRYAKLARASRRTAYKPPSMTGGD